MTPAQKRKYWREFAPVRESWLAAGPLTASETDARRHALQRKALGYDRSSSALSNREFDAVIAAFRAEADPADFDAQMQVQDSPDRLRTEMLARCNTAMEHIGKGRNPDGYLATIAKSVDGALKWPPANPETLRKVMGIVEKRAAILRKTQPVPNRQNPSIHPESPFDSTAPF